MKKGLLVSLAAFAAVSVISLPLAHAQDSMTNESAGSVGKSTDLNQPGSVSGEDQSQSGMSQSQSQSQESQGNAQAKQSLSPHTIMMQTALQSAIDRLNGLKTQYQVSQAPDQQFLNHAKMYSRDIKKDVSEADVHKGELQTGIRQFPNIAQSDDYKTLNSTFSGLKSLSDSWTSKASNMSYWQDRSKALSDINQLQQRLTAALDKTKSFNSSKLDVTLTG